MQWINEILHYLSSNLNRILQNSLLFLPLLFRSHPTFPLINLVRLLLFLILCKCLMLRLYYNYFIIIYRSQPAPD
jgi:hypothetical protein